MAYLQVADIQRCVEILRSRGIEVVIVGNQRMYDVAALRRTMVRELGRADEFRRSIQEFAQQVKREARKRDRPLSPLPPYVDQSHNFMRTTQIFSVPPAHAAARRDARRQRRTRWLAELLT